MRGSLVTGDLMADDHSQRPFRASEPPLRGQAKTSNNDPLAELARLIGQTDPFGEYGRDRAGRASPQPTEYSDWNSQQTRTPYTGQNALDPHRSAGTQRLGGNGYYGQRQTPVEQQMAELEREIDRHYGRHGYNETPAAPPEDSYQTQQDARAYSNDQG